jgi:hypothetical protein
LSIHDVSLLCFPRSPSPAKSRSEGVVENEEGHVPGPSQVINDCSQPQLPSKNLPEQTLRAAIQPSCGDNDGGDDDDGREDLHPNAKRQRRTKRRLT